MGLVPSRYTDSEEAVVHPVMRVPYSDEQRPAPIVREVLEHVNSNYTMIGDMSSTTCEYALVCPCYACGRPSFEHSDGVDLFVAKLRTPYVLPDDPAFIVPELRFCGNCVTPEYAQEDGFEYIHRLVQRGTPHQAKNTQP